MFCQHVRFYYNTHMRNLTFLYLFISAIQMKIMKKVKDEEFWPRLLADKVQEKTNVKIDWDRYVDEDEAEGKDFDTG